MSEGADSTIVAGTLYLLVLFSVVTWSVILIKAFEHWRIGSHLRDYMPEFWRAGDLQAAARLPEADGAAARIAKAGFGALASGDSETHDLAHSAPLEQVLERSLRQQLSRERRSMESGLALLASIGSTSPFVGLFGTVWGIMHALQEISRTGSASLDVVAGPIGEALIATAVGIAVAVPAVLAYNFFIRSSKRMAADLEDFATDFLNLAVRLASTRSGR
jgi:biopolymer transport protein ExbB